MLEQQGGRLGARAEPDGGGTATSRRATMRRGASVVIDHAADSSVPGARARGRSQSADREPADDQQPLVAIRGDPQRILGPHPGRGGGTGRHPERKTRDGEIGHRR